MQKHTATWESFIKTEATWRLPSLAMKGGFPSYCPLFHLQFFFSLLNASFVPAGA